MDDDKLRKKNNNSTVTFRHCPWAEFDESPGNEPCGSMRPNLCVMLTRRGLHFSNIVAHNLITAPSHVARMKPDSLLSPHLCRATHLRQSRPDTLYSICGIVHIHRSGCTNGCGEMLAKAAKGHQSEDAAF